MNIIIRYNVLGLNYFHASRLPNLNYLILTTVNMEHIIYIYIYLCMGFACYNSFGPTAQKTSSKLTHQTMVSVRIIGIVCTVSKQGDISPRLSHSILALEWDFGWAHATHNVFGRSLYM